MSFLPLYGAKPCYASSHHQSSFRVASSSGGFSLGARVKQPLSGPPGWEEGVARSCHSTDILYWLHPSAGLYVLPVQCTLNSDSVWGSPKELLPTSPMVSSSLYGEEYHESILLTAAAIYCPEVPGYFRRSKDSFPPSYGFIPFLSFQEEGRELTPQMCTHCKWICLHMVPQWPHSLITFSNWHKNHELDVSSRPNLTHRH